MCRQRNHAQDVGFGSQNIPRSCYLLTWIGQVLPRVTMDKEIVSNFTKWISLVFLVLAVLIWNNPTRHRDTYEIKSHAPLITIIPHPNYTSNEEAPTATSAFSSSSSSVSPSLPPTPCRLGHTNPPSTSLGSKSNPSSPNFATSTP